MLVVPLQNQWTGLTACYQSGYGRYAAFFMSVIYLPFSFLWVGILGSIRARRSLIRSVNPIYPPARVSHGRRFSRNRKQRSKS